MSNNFATDYIDVAARIAEFRTKYPDGSLQPNDRAKPYEVLTLGSDTFIVYCAAAYRRPDDALPGVGIAYEQYPGRTPYTRGSELQNAETSAWGRAIMAALAADSRKGIASAEDVRNRQAERDEPLSSNPRAVLDAIAAAGKARGKTVQVLANEFYEWSKGEQITAATAVVLTEFLEHLTKKTAAA